MASEPHEPADPRGPGPGGSSNRPLVLGGAVVAAVIVVFGLVFLLTRGDDDGDVETTPTSVEDDTADDTTTTSGEGTATTGDGGGDDGATTTTAPADGRARPLSDEELDAALLQAADLPEGYELTETRPARDLEVCGVAPAEGSVVTSLSHFYQHGEAAGIGHGIVQFTAGEAEAYLTGLAEAADGCVDGDFSVVEASGGDLGDQMLIMRLQPTDPDAGPFDGYGVYQRRGDLLSVIFIASEEAVDTAVIDELTPIVDERLSRLGS